MKTEITLPIELHKLNNLNDVGTTFILMTMPYMEEETKQYWIDNFEFQTSLKHLKHDGIITMRNNSEIEIDLTLL